MPVEIIKNERLEKLTEWVIREVVIVKSTDELNYFRLRLSRVDSDKDAYLSFKPICSMHVSGLTVQATPDVRYTLLPVEELPQPSAIDKAP